jgi:hypothetical protein
VRVYATIADYNRFAEVPFGTTTNEDEAPEGEDTPEQSADDRLLEKRLRSASIEVEKLTRLARYYTDDDGYPTDADIAEAFAEATCAIVEHWFDTDDPRGVDATQGAVRIGSVSLGTTSASTDSLTPRERLARRIGDKAIDILATAGLITSAVAHS